MINVGAGWKKQGKNGPYMSLEVDMGIMGKFKAMMFPNTKKKSANEPDYSIVIPDDAFSATAPKASPIKPKITPAVKPVITPRVQTAPESEPPSDLWDREETQEFSEIPF